jgi:hypothetical protein
MSKEYEFDRLTVPTPEPVAKPKRELVWLVAHIGIISFCVLVAAFMIAAGIRGVYLGAVGWGICEIAMGAIIAWGRIFNHSKRTGQIMAVVLAVFFAGSLIFDWPAAKPAPVTQTWPEAGPSSVFGMTQAPDVEPCPDCECDKTWLAQFVHALDTSATSPLEVRDVLARAYTESRFTPSIVSDTGDWGICQINIASWPEYDGARLLTDPEYAAGACLAVYRVYRAKCGDNWQCCYRRGVVGCRKGGAR